MSYEEKEPVAKNNTGPIGGVKYSHDAYGVVILTQRSGKSSLFGSDIGHHGCMSIKVCRAELHRNLNSDFVYSRETLVEFEMTSAQWAEFVSSVGKGGGTPVTLRAASPRGTKVEMMPKIKKTESKHETHYREIKEAAEECVARIENQINALGQLIESGKIGKQALKEIHKQFCYAREGIPNTMEFVVKSAEEALEKATSDAKIEVEAFISQSAQRIGLKRIQDLSIIEDKS